MTTNAAGRGVLVLGGSGAIGQTLTELLAAEDVPVIAAARRPPATLPPGSRFRRIDLRDRDALRSVVREARVVVDASGVDDATVASTVITSGRDLVDLSAHTGHLDALRDHDALARAERCTVFAGVGLAPGLTNLLAVHAHDNERDDGDGGRRIELDLVLGLGERHGPAATTWMLHQLAAPPRHAHRRVSLPAGFGNRTLRWVDFAEQHALARDLGVPVVSRCGFDPPALGIATETAARVPGLRRVLATAAGAASRLTRRDWWIAAARTVDGTTCWATGRRQNDATALVAAWAVHRLLDRERTNPPGVHDLHHVADLDAVSPWLQRHGIAVALARTGRASSAARSPSPTPSSATSADPGTRSASSPRTTAPGRPPSPTSEEKLDDQTDDPARSHRGRHPPDRGARSGGHRPARGDAT